jgi:hypothetical protein
VQIIQTGIGQIKSIVMKKTGASAGKEKITVVTTMKDEGAYILDWISYYKALGVDDFVVFTNDCTDPTDHILRTLQAKGIIEHRFNKVMRRGAHKSALMWARYEPKVREADWLMVIDCDEYLQINVGDGTLPSLLEANKDADAISLVWRIYGNAGVKRIEDRPIPQIFTRAQPMEGGEGERRFFKTIFRNNGKFDRMGVHRPFLAVPPSEVHWVVPDGNRMMDEEIDGSIGVQDNYGYESAQLNHYALRSIDGFLNKRNRGRANHFGGAFEPSYWRRFDKNQVEETAMVDRFEIAREFRDELMADPDLQRFHEEAVEWHTRRARKARRTDEGKAFLQDVRRYRRKMAREEAAAAEAAQSGDLAAE